MLAATEAFGLSERIRATGRSSASFVYVRASSVYSELSLELGVRWGLALFPFIKGLSNGAVFFGHAALGLMAGV
jgi:hypothetical protein